MASISAALRDLLADHDLPVEEALTRHFTDSYRQSTDGEWIDRGGFATQVEHLRSLIKTVEIEVLDELARGSAYAERHIIRLVGRDGSITTREVYLVAELAADGRFDSLQETLRPITAS